MGQRFTTLVSPTRESSREAQAVTEERIDLGRRGEELAAQLLGERGWEVLARNVRLRGGEIDLIARDGDTLAFIEVKTASVRRNPLGSGPERAALAVTPEKQRKVRRLAAEWLTSDALPRGVAEFRFDVIGIELDPFDPAIAPRIEHLQDAFR